MKNQPRNFSGEVDVSGRAEDPSMWLDHFELVSVSNGWEGDKDKLQQVPIRLVGEAEDWFMVNRDWILAKDALRYSIIKLYEKPKLALCTTSS